VTIGSVIRRHETVFLCNADFVLPQGSKWTLQAMLMNGRIDYLNWTIKPDQMHVIEPFLGMLILVFFDVAFYPLLAMVGIRKPLQKLTLSGILAVIAFVLTATLQFKIIVRHSFKHFFNFRHVCYTFLKRETLLRYHQDKGA